MKPVSSTGEIGLTCLDLFEIAQEGSAFFCRRYSFFLESVLLPLCQSTRRLSWLYPHSALHMFETSGARDPYETSIKQHKITQIPTEKVFQKHCD